jgi:hypothetical protein
MNYKAALAAILSIIAIVAAFAVLSFQLAYPESAPTGWLLVAGIVFVCPVVCWLLLRVGKER